LHDTTTNSIITHLKFSRWDYILAANGFTDDVVHNTLFNLPWKPAFRNGRITRYSAWITLGRCTCPYTYAGSKWESSDASAVFLDLVKLITRIVGKPEGYYNGINCNYYDDGSQSLGMHSDDEKLFVSADGTASIVSFSFGSTRKMTFRHYFSAEDSDFNVLLESKDLLHMDGQTQLHYQHAIPRNTSGWRYNITLRRVVQHTRHCRSFNYKLQGH
jgi:alkylated DNA repair dioxygenase AlkB